MKKIFLLLAIVFFSTNTFSQSTFGFVEKHGFGQIPFGGYNSSIMDMCVFKGNVYVGMGKDIGYVYRSSTGDHGSFTQVYADLNYMSACHFRTTADSGGYMYMIVNPPGQPVLRQNGGQGNSTHGVGAIPPKVLRSADGSTWNDYLIFSGLTLQNSIPNDLNLFKGTGTVDSVYVSYRDINNNLFVLRNSLTTADFNDSLGTWDTVCNFAAQFGTPAYTNVVASKIYHGKLYYATSNNKLFVTSDGRSLTQITAYDTAMVGRQIYNISCMEILNDTLFFGTDGYGSGAEIWKMVDDTTFIAVDTIPGTTIYSMKSTGISGDRLWVSAGYTFSGSFQIYSSINGNTYALEDNTEFGDFNNDPGDGIPMTEFNNHLYVGCKNYAGGFRLANNSDQISSYTTNGAQIWRTCLVGTMPAVTIAGGDTIYTCVGTSIVLNTTLGMASYMWNTGSTTSSTNASAVGDYCVTAVTAAGCRNTDDALLLNPVLTNPIVTKNFFPIYNEVVCQGDTTQPLIAVDPDNDFHSIKVLSTNAGVIAPSSPAFATNRSLTIEMWIKPKTNGIIASQYDTLSSSTWIYNQYGIMTIEGSADQLFVSLPNVGTAFVGYLYSNQWNHVALRYNSSTYYLDAVINGVTQLGVTGASDRGIANDNGGYDAYKFMMSGNNEFWSYWEANATGSIRDVRVWNQARTDGQIDSNKYVLSPGPHPNLVYHYKTLETSGTIANDASGNGLNAQVFGTFVSPTPVVWSANPTLIPIAGTDSVRFAPTQPTHYYMQYTDTQYGCVISDSFLVEPTFVKIMGTPASCGGNPAYLYAYSNSTLDSTKWFSSDYSTSFLSSNLNVTPVLSTDSLINLEGYSGSCHVKDSIHVKVGPAFLSTNTNQFPITINACENVDVVLHALDSTGTPPYTFDWLIGDFATTTNVDSFTFHTPFFPGTEYISVDGHDAIGCNYINGPTYHINTAGSTNLTGHVSTPPPSSLNMNNGYVYVFKHQPGSAALDTVGYTSVDVNGDYLFTPLNAGDYLIKVLPNETAFPLAVPTYYGNAFQWDSSWVYTHGCAQEDTADIQVIEMSGTTGIASISGYVLEGPGFGNARYGLGGGHDSPFIPGGPLKGIDVKLGKNPGGGVQARVRSDSSGFYQFLNVPVGGYKVYVDVPNLPMDSTREITIAGADSSIQNNYFIDSARVYINPDTVTFVGMNELKPQSLSEMLVFPNPAKNMAYISYQLKESTKVSFEITNAMGQKLKVEPARNYPKGDNIFVLNFETLKFSGGVYFVSMITIEGKQTQRIVVID